MDKNLLRGEKLKSIAQRYNVSEDSLGRHKKHMQLVIAKAAAVADVKDLVYGSALLAEIGRIKADAERLQIESERRQDVRAALKAIHERLAIVELEAKLSGQIETGQKSVTVNLQTISREEALEYARDVFELLGPGEVPQRMLPTSVGEGEPDTSIAEPGDGN